MNRHTSVGVLVGGIFAVAITTVAVLDAFAAGGLVLLASATAGLAAGVCIGGLIAANFAMLAPEARESKELAVPAPKPAHAAA